MVYIYINKLVAKIPNEIQPYDFIVYDKVSSKIFFK